MPAKTEKQRRAMGAAASGRSTLGIPKSVGKKFMKHKQRATSKLLRKRSASNTGGASVGGGT